MDSYAELCVTCFDIPGYILYTLWLWGKVVCMCVLLLGLMFEMDVFYIFALVSAQNN